MLALVLGDETRPASHPQAQGARLFVPAIWPLEVANALRNVVRRGRLADEDVPAVCARIEGYAVEVVGGVDAGVLGLDDVQHRRVVAAGIGPEALAEIRVEIDVSHRRHSTQAIAAGAGSVGDSTCESSSRPAVSGKRSAATITRQ